jgi:hypothetical protein
MFFESERKIQNKKLIKELFSEDFSNNNFNLLKNNILSEDYYGKNPALLEAESLLDIIKEKLNKDPLYNPNFSKENLELRKIFKELFNVEEFKLDWFTNQASANAVTLPLGQLAFNKYSDFDIIKTKDGVKFKNAEGKIILIFCFTSLFTLSKLTSAQVVAVILHEVGHNFYNSSYSYISRKIQLIYITILELFKKNNQNEDIIPELIGSIISVIALSSGSTRESFLQLEKNIQKSPFSKQTFIFLQKIISLIFDTVSIIKQLYKSLFIVTGLSFVSGIIGSATISALSLVESIFFDKYKEEKFCDNFATSYGYGPETAGVQLSFSIKKKMAFSSKIIDYIPIYRDLYQADVFIRNSIVGLGECHPDEYTRVAEQAKLLKNEIKKNNLDPKVKKQIVEDLQEIENIYSQMKESSYLKKNNQYFEYFINKIIFKVFKVERKDAKELILPTKNYDYKELKPQSER